MVSSEFGLIRITLLDDTAAAGDNTETTTDNKENIHWPILTTPISHSDFLSILPWARRG